MAANLLANPNFGNPPVSPALVPGADYPYQWPGQSWETWNNSGVGPNCSYTSTNIITLSEVAKSSVAQPTFCSGIQGFLENAPPTDQVLQICTNNVANGIGQVFTNRNPLEIEASVWVFVLSGQVQMGIATFVKPRQPGPPSQGIPGVVLSSKMYQWEQLRLRAQIKPGDTGTELFIYSSNTSSNGAWFFAANASVVEIA